MNFGWVLALLLALPLQATTFEQRIQAQHHRADAMRQLGEQLFTEKALSGSGRIACSSCHQRTLAYSSPQALMPGGNRLQLRGNRAVPGLTYLQAVPQFSEHFSEDDGNDSIDNGPTGGLDWDGRADRARDQVRQPLFASNEMASTAAIILRVLATRSYRQTVKALYGAKALLSPQAAVDAAASSLAAFLHSPRFYPYSSKYDAVLRGEATLSPAEARGLAAFNDPKRGNCASCHFSGYSANGAPPLFTDYGYSALGLPRNPRVPANADPRFFDMGLCGPYRHDLASKKRYCGRFRTPSLRNVALKKHFFHNGVITSLHDAIAFYASRDSNPGRWYPRNGAGQIEKFNDLPKAYWPNIEMTPPFGAQAGAKPAFSEQDVRDIEAFLGTLSDGYDGAKNPPSPASPVQGG